LRFKIKTIVPFMGMFSISLAMFYFLFSIVNFPNHIQLSEKTLHNLKFNSPFSAKIESDTIGALKVNSKPVEGDISVDLNGSLTIQSEDPGTAQMTLSAFGLPIKRVQLDILPEIEIVPCGLTVGVRINTDGVLVLGTGKVESEDGSSYNPCEGKLISGDLILNANGEYLSNKNDLQKAVADSTTPIELTVKRDNELITTTVSPAKSAEDQKNKLGVWVRDATQGIGTITYFNPQTRVFGALGHGILDVDTKKLMTVKDGSIMEANITDVKKGGKGEPGELVGVLQSKSVLGDIKVNTPYGIYGFIDISGMGKITHEKMSIGLQDQVHEGPATIYSDVDDEIKEYDVFIESVNRFSNDETKGMVIRITDPSLLRKTNGIVQGMSGSPIMQDGKIIGAVTHVFVRDPTKGYGIFIENMLKQERTLS
jgi:stage IV sporulation protein B